MVLDSSLCDKLQELPYPTIRIGEPNLRWARILTELFCGQNGEMTAVNQYVYQHFILGETAAEDAGTIECIAQNEMQHFDLLGKLIYALGGDPKLRVSVSPRQSVWWNGGWLDYSHIRSTLVNNNIRAEQKAIAAYRSAIDLIDDRNIDEILERIILDEERHIELFREMLEQADGR